MYRFKTRVRYSEVNKEKQIDMFSTINYFQDCSTFQSEDIGKGIEYLEDNNRLWLMNAWQVNVNRYPKLGEEITISTWPYAFKSMYGYRNFLITDSNNQDIIVANSIWVYMDTLEYHPIKVTEEVLRNYMPQAKYDMDYAPRKIAIPDELTTLESFPVIKSTIDIYNHVNNGQYIRMAEEFLPEGFKCKQMRAEYKMSAVFGDIIVPMINYANNIFTVVLANTEGKPYTIVEFAQ